VAAEIGPAQEKPDLRALKGIFAKMDEIRKRAKPLPRGGREGWGGVAEMKQVKWRGGGESVTRHVVVRS